MERGDCSSSEVFVVVDLGQLEPDAGPAGRCVELETGSDGIAALRAAGATVTGSARYGSAFVCRIDGRPAPRERLELPGGEVHSETCSDTPPPTAYWSYWHAAPGTCDWTYSTVGAATRTIADGSAEGWSFSLGSAPGRPPAPRLGPCERQETGTIRQGARTESPPRDAGTGRVDPLAALVVVVGLAVVATVATRRRRGRGVRHDG